jgi:TPR repeat protein
VLRLDDDLYALASRVAIIHVFVTFERAYLSVGREAMNEFRDRPPLPSDWKPENVRALRRLAQRDDANALVDLGVLCEEGLRHPDGTVLVRRNLREARRCFERAVALGDAAGMDSLATFLSRPKARASDIARAERLYRMSFRKGYTTAAYNLAVTYRRLGRYRDAFRWFQRAHEAGDPSALLQLGLAELYGVGTKRDPVAALSKLRRMARSRIKYWPASTGENVDAMLAIARAFLDGWLLPRDHDEGLRWLQRAAEWGSLTAKAMLTEC